MNQVDTRVFGDRDNILYGDGSRSKQSKNLEDIVLGREASLKAYKNVISYIRGGKKGNISRIFNDKNTPKTTITAIQKWFNNYDDNEILNRALWKVASLSDANNQQLGLYNRVQEAPNPDKIARYTVFNIPSTNVRCIGLFKMDKFDLSDAIKKGSLRSTSPLITDNGGKEAFIKNSDDRVPVTYDDNIEPELAQNFSLNDLDTLNKGSKKDHFKNVQQYGQNGNTKYTTINQFLDKSIVYAKYALQEERYKPDVIVTAPSSSKMNEYYATNLSNKLGCEYINDFFERNIVNAHLGEQYTDEELLKQGLTPLDIVDLKNQIKLYAYKEMVYLIEEPLRKFINSYSNILLEVAPMDNVLKILSKYCFKTLNSYATSDIMQKHLASNFLQIKVQDKNDKKLLNTLTTLIKMNIGLDTFDEVLTKMLTLLKQYSEQVLSKGYKIIYGAQSSKITSIEKQYRNYVEGSFIIADKYMNQNHELFSRLKNSKFLIVDEDVNSGTSFKLTIQALEEKIPNMTNEEEKNNMRISSQNLMCLANGFADSGR